MFAENHPFLESELLGRIPQGEDFITMNNEHLAFEQTLVSISLLAWEQVRIDQFCVWQLEW